MVVLVCWRFHIHMNPFQIVCVRDKITKKEITTGEYEGMKDVWKDTISVEGATNGENPELGVEIEYRTRYARYIGQFVLHCHILPPRRHRNDAECGNHIVGNRAL